jgi:predicted nucleic acid-binding protein
MKVLVDTNVLLDVLAKRQPFYADSAAIWTLAEEGQIEGLVSAVSFTNIFYIVRKLAGADTAQRTLVLLRDTFTAVACDIPILNRAIDSDFKDFEGAVQYFTALQAGAACLVSRNPDHFPRTNDCPVISPAEFLATHSFE